MKTRKLDKKIILKTIQKNKDKIKKEFGVKKLWLFESYARGKQTKDSDIDFLVEFESKEDYLNSLDLQVFLNCTFEKDIGLFEKNSIRKEYKDYILNSSYKEELKI